MYLNILNFSNNVFGLGSAARVYFDKPAAQLSPNESALLAGIINNPSRLNPVTNPALANSRRRLVLSRMQKYGRLSAADFQRFKDEDISINGVFFDQYANFLIDDSVRILGVSKAELFSKNFQISTYLDSKLQSKINNYLKDYDFSAKDDSIIQVLVMNKFGEIVANSASVSMDLSGIRRQPGSIIKPAIAYAPALEKKLISPLTPILDSPESFGGYQPKNHKNRNLGWISAQQALISSQNIPAVRLMSECGVDYSRSVAHKLGYEFADGDDHLALALGGMSKGAKMTEIAGSFQAFLNGGLRYSPSHISSISTHDGREIYRRERLAQRAVSEETAFFINEMLSECAKSGTARRIGCAAAAKTGTVGTAEGNTDAFTVAYNNEFVVAVWIGAREKLLPNSVNGGTHPCFIAKNVLGFLGADSNESVKFPRPASIFSVDIDRREYEKNHRIVKAESDSYKKDRISGYFDRSNLPKNNANPKDFVFRATEDNIDINNFEILD